MWGRLRHRRARGSLPGPLHDVDCIAGTRVFAGLARHLSRNSGFRGTAAASVSGGVVSGRVGELSGNGNGGEDANNEDERSERGPFTLFDQADLLGARRVRPCLTTAAATGCASSTSLGEKLVISMLFNASLRGGE